MSKHLRVRRRDRIYDRLSIVLDIISAWMYRRARATKAYFRNNTVKEIVTTVLAWTLFLFLMGYGPVMMVVAILLWR